MSTKENFSKAAYELFGVGSAKAEEQTEHLVEKNTVAAKSAVKLPEKTVEVKTIQPVAHNFCAGCMIKTNGDIEIIGSYDGDIIAGGRVILHNSHSGNISAQTIELTDCTINGDLNIENKLVVGANAAVNGSVCARELECAGTVNGDASINGRVSLKSSADIRGNIRAVTMNMEDGARIKGGFEICQNVFGK